MLGLKRVSEGENISAMQWNILVDVLESLVKGFQQNAIVSPSGIRQRLINKATTEVTGSSRIVMANVEEDSQDAGTFLETTLLEPIGDYGVGAMAHAYPLFLDTISNGYDMLYPRILTDSTVVLLYKVEEDKFYMLYPSLFNIGPSCAGGD
jgi:hypothetical protein